VIVKAIECFSMATTALDIGRGACSVAHQSMKSSIASRAVSMTSFLGSAAWLTIIARFAVPFCLFNRRPLESDFPSAIQYVWNKAPSPCLFFLQLIRLPDEL